ncbi:MAG: His/Gly/Thr/Pro-type tRNA ligase C-terminal domain-containing protein [Patescibacteria group bacterium]
MSITVRVPVIKAAAPRRGAPVGFIKLSSDVSSFYGFKPIKAQSFAAAAAALSAQHAAHPTEPALAYFASHSPAQLPLQTGLNLREVSEFTISAVGAPGSVGEVILIKTAANIAEEWGATVSRVRVNALGDKDSKLRFARELASYLRRHATELNDECREMLGRDPIAAFACQTLVSREVVEAGPRPMNFLTEKSRAHFREVLEHLEKIGLPYELDDTLVGDEREPRVAFALDLAEEDATIRLVQGGRFDDYLRRITNKKEGSAVSASLFFEKQGPARGAVALPEIRRRAKIFFVQLGLPAKLMGLRVLEELRRAGVPVLQTFNSSSLGPQLQAARDAKVTHLIIMGAREALDGTVLVREMSNSSQEVMPVAHLARHLKNLK